MKRGGVLRRWRRTASGTVLTLLIGTLVVLAYRYDGKPFTEVELNDGSVWVTNKSLSLVARLNPQIKELDLGVDATTSQFDIIQRATDLYIDDDGTERSVKNIDIARASVTDPVALPPDARVLHGGSTFAVVDPAGKAWVRPERTFSTFVPKSAKPDATEVLAAAVGADGRAWLLDRDGSVTDFSFDKTGALVEGDSVDLGVELGADPTQVRLSAVGDVPVLFDLNTSEVHWPGGKAIIETPDPTQVALQQPSTEDSLLYVATRESLVSVDLDSQKVTKLSRGTVAGRPADPVVLAATGCVYAAWSDPASQYNYLRDCPGTEQDDEKPILDMEAGAELVFRVNRNVIVLNDSVTGDTWLVQEPGKDKVDNWPSVDPKNENRSKLEEVTEEIPDQENRPPKPKDDDLGARPGRDTVLPVVARNDSDPDGDILSISKTQYVSGPEVQVRIVGGGTQLQVSVPANATGVAQFRYYVTDGRVNDEVYATVRLQIRDDTQEVAPKRMDKREPQLTVARGGTSSYFVLADYEDFDGDDLTLTDVSARGGEVEYRPDGTITFSDTGEGQPVTEIQYVVDDGKQAINEKIPVNIVEKGAPPELVPDLASGVAGTRVVVQPLANDRNPEGDGLRLKDVKVVGDDQDTSIEKDLEGGTFTFTADRARSYYLSYSAYNSSKTVTSQVRLDIESPPKDNRPPVAVRDKATITPGGTAQVDLLLNDLDPDGDVLVVQRIGRSSIPGVKVSIVDKRLAIVSSAADITGQSTTVPYTISDGRNQVNGDLVITGRAADKGNRNPVANKDEVTVRAGAVTTVPVTANDSDPDGSKPRLFQSDIVNDQKLNVWVTGDSLRLRAPDKPGTYSVIYGVRDDQGLKAAAEVSIFVVADSEKNNRNPTPQPITDRVISGRIKRIPVDFIGADPDGDSVAFRSILTAPTLGRVVETGVDYIRYEAFKDRAGTDFFQVLVQDKYGATGVAEVRVGVVPPQPDNQSPVALDDNVLVQPNRTISYGVLANDVDPDDDPLRISELNTTAKAQRDGGLIQLDVGDAPENGSAVSSVGYSIEDSAGAKDSAVLKVTASRTAPFYAPIARDDVADLGDIIGRSPGDTIEVTVLDNDLDFDGAKDDLEVTNCDAGAGGTCEVTEKGTVKVTLAADDQVMLYQLDDADDESTSTYGVIYVTGTDNVPPQLTTDERRVPVKAVTNEPVTLDLNDLVVVRSGRTVRLAPGAVPTGINGIVSPVDGTPTSLQFTPARDYVGAASVTVSVTDGGEGGDGALTSLLTIPIDVRPANNVAPVMRDGTVDVTVEGEDQKAQIDLAGLTTDANKGDLDTMTWTVKASDPTVSASVVAKTSVMTVEATGQAKNGDLGKITVVADDGKGGTDEAVIAARIVDTARPLTQVAPIVVNADRDQRVQVDVAAYAVNPYPDKPLKVSAPTIEGNGGSKLSDIKVDGTIVSFTPTTVGSATLRVTVADDSDDRLRDVPARIAVTVIAPPDAPTRPVLSSVEASSAVLSWREPASNGSPITEYQVEGSAGYTQACTATTCRLVGLTPGQAYTFTVRAKNEKGLGEPSPESEEVTPNKAPDLMSPPTIEVAPSPTGGRMDRQLNVTWSPPTNEGSEITAYEIKEAGGDRTWQAAPNERSKVLTGLNNGTPYAFEIRALNAVEPRRQFSAPSRSVAPFGIPLRSGAPPVLTASEATDFDDQPFVRIDWQGWSESQSNGNPVKKYVISCNGCNRGSYDVDASQTSRTFGVADGIEKGKTVSFTVAGANDAGTSDPSPSVSGRPYTKPGPVRGLAEVGTSPADRQATVSFEPPLDNGGLEIAYYAARLDYGQVVQLASGTNPTLTFGDNRTGGHTVEVWTVTRNGTRLVEGPAQTITGIRTWGKPNLPSGDPGSNSYYQVQAKVSPGTPNGRDITGVEVLYPDGNWRTPPLGTFEAEASEGGAQVDIKVRTVSDAPDPARKYSDVRTITAQSLPKVLSLTTYGCQAGSDPVVRGVCFNLTANGFPSSGTRTSYESTYGSSNCPGLPEALTKAMNGNVQQRIGGSNCVFTGNDRSFKITAGTASATAPPP